MDAHLPIIKYFVPLISSLQLFNDSTLERNDIKMINDSNNSRM